MFGMVDTAAVNLSRERLCARSIVYRLEHLVDLWQDVLWDLWMVLTIR